MHPIIEQINQLNFPPRNQELLAKTLEEAFSLIAPELATKYQSMLLREDFEFLSTQYRFYKIHNTFAGGIIFLREPETIEEIRIEYYSFSNSAVVSVEYASEQRNARNIKHKPGTGKIESTTWNMLGIFPHFAAYENSIKIYLLAIIGKLTKVICEHHKADSWFMQYEKPFEIQIFLDHEIVLTYHVEID